MESIIVLNPTTESNKSETSLAPRLSTLEGKVLGVVNNSKRNSDVFIKHLVNKIKDSYNLKDVIWINKRNPSLPMDDNVLQQLKLTHAVIAGVGD